MLDDTRSAELAALLAWYRDMGVDHAVDETPIDWLSRGDRAPGSRLQGRNRRGSGRGRAARRCGLRRAPRRLSRADRGAACGRHRASFRPPLPMRP